MNSLNPAADEAKFNLQLVGRRERMIPPTLLTKPLAPEKLNLLNEDEKRLYTIQKGKYDTYLRILEKKKSQNEHPGDRRFKMEELAQLIVGKHHEEEVEDEEEVVELNEMKYMGRDETFEAQRLENFEIEVRRILHSTRRVARLPHEYIPKDTRMELDLPVDLEDN